MLMDVSAKGCNSPWFVLADSLWASRLNKKEAASGWDAAPILFQTSVFDDAVEARRSPGRHVEGGFDDFRAPEGLTGGIGKGHRIDGRIGAGVVEGGGGILERLDQTGLALGDGPLRRHGQDQP